MTTEDKYKNQRKFIEARKAEGLERLVLWVKPEDKAAIKEIARQPQAVAKLRAEIRKDVEKHVWLRMARQLEDKTRRAIKAQERAKVRRQEAGSNRPPELIRFAKRPPATLRDVLKAAGWIYEPLRSVWILPKDPATWTETERLLDDLESYDIQRLVEPLD